MAFLRPHARSPYWYLVFRNLETGAREEKSTKLRRDRPNESRKAQKQADELSAKEAKVAPQQRGDFPAWVTEYIQQFYRRETTRKRSEAAWLALSRWMREEKIRHPGQIRYQHASDYMTWRKANGAKHNTARLEIKFLSFLMNEAVRRDYCDRNPIAVAKVEREAVTEKPELSVEQLEAARAAFAANKKEWMQVVFEIMLDTGCRFAEASMPMDRIDFETETILMEDSKRKANDPRKFYPVPMSNALAEFLQSLPPRDRTVPILTGRMNQSFNVIMRRATGTTSHALRVSFITRCHRSGLSESDAMGLVNHSSRLVHKIYTRLNSTDRRRARNQVPSPLPPARYTPAPSESKSSSHETDIPCGAGC